MTGEQPERLQVLERRLHELEAENQSLKRQKKFGLVWEDRPEAVEHQMANRLPVLMRKSRLDVCDSDPQGRPHVLIEGDNLHALTVLQATHKGGVDVIYIDPPYNTGSEFVYNDRLVGLDDRWRHSAWLSFMDKRLRVAHALLRDTGIIFISIDDNEQAHLRMLCDQVFGEANFVEQFLWQKSSGGSSLSKFVRSDFEYVLCYAKRKSALTDEFVGKVPTSGHEDATLIKSSNGVGRLVFPAKSIRFTDAGLEGTSISPFSDTDFELKTAFTVMGGTNDRDVEIRARFIWQQSYLDEQLAAGTQIIAKTKFMRLRHIKSARNTVVKPTKSITNRENGAGYTVSGSSALRAILGGGFDFPKPESLIVYLLRMVTHYRKGAVVLDFFAGSGTTLHAVAQLNAEDGGTRQCILVTNNENDICRTVTQPRIKAVLTGKWADGKPHDPLPGSLRYYQTSFQPKRRNRDQLLTDLAKAATDLLAVKESAHDLVLDDGPLRVLNGPGSTVAVVTDALTDHADLVKISNQYHAEGDRRVAYLFTWSDSGVESEIAEQWPGWEVEPLPAPLLAAIRQGITAARSGR